MSDSSVKSKKISRSLAFEKSRASVESYRRMPKKKVTLDENQKVKLYIKIGQENNATKHSFFKRVANSRRFTHTDSHTLSKVRNFFQHDQVLEWT